MDRKSQIATLKKRLLREVSLFCRNDGRQWKSSATQTLRLFASSKSKSVFFGGTLRSLLTSRVYSGKPGRPRDIDLVVVDTEMDSLRRCFHDSISRETRFGGLQLQRGNWHFDVWPLQSTWAFVNDGVEQPDLHLLPQTTFFNLEAIAVETWSNPGKQRKLYSGDDQFFHGVLDRVLEINREHNPFPELCIVRALVTAASLEFSIGPRLARYIVEHSPDVTAQTLEQLQIKHYGCLRKTGVEMIEMMQFVSESLNRDGRATSVVLPKLRQLAFWPAVTGSGRHRKVESSVS